MAGGVAVPATATATASTPPKLRVGSLDLTHCAGGLPGWCGSIKVPLDYRASNGPTITAGFEWLPAAAKPTGTIVAIEGGPGYSSHDSLNQYQPMIGGLAKTKNLLLFDLRGTGLSTPINCSALQNFTGRESGPAFAKIVGECGDKLNHTWRAKNGAWVHASDLFDTANSARDLAATLGRLGQHKVDLYGDSYGSYFAQTFGSRYPKLLRSVTLDATYEVLGLEPWYSTSATTARQAFNAACDRAAACHKQAPGHSWDRISSLARRLRAASVTGMTTNLSGKQVRQTVTLRTLVDLVNNAGYDPSVYKELDAAARALLDHHDPVPLLRLASWSTTLDNVYPSDPTAYSDGVYFAVACTDYPQLFNMKSSPATRAAQLRSSVAAETASGAGKAFAPFTPAEVIQMNGYTEAYDSCLNWPAPTSTDPPITRTPPLMPKSLPVLVISGDLDSLTPPPGNAHVARQVGTSARYIEIPNHTHVVAEPSSAWPGLETCGDTVYRQFVTNPGKLNTLDTSCTRHTPPVPLVGSFPKTLANAIPATATKGNRAGTQALREAEIAAAVPAMPWSATARSVVRPTRDCAEAQSPTVDRTRSR